MAFTIKEIIDLKGIFLLVFLIIPSHATNLDCYGKAFHCVNSTHFMICVDLGRGISTTIDDFVIPCPSPTVCKRTNRYECEFPTPTAPESEVSTIANTQTADSEVTTFVPLITSSIPFEEYFNTLRTTTLSENELQPFTADTRLVIEPITLRQENVTNSFTTEIAVTDKSISRDANTPKSVNINTESSVIRSNGTGSNIENNISINFNMILNDTKQTKGVQELTTILDIPEIKVTDSPVLDYNSNITSFDITRAVTEQTATTESLLTKNLGDSLIDATRNDTTSAINNQTTSAGDILTNDFKRFSINTTPTFITSAMTEQTRESVHATTIESTDAINNQTVIIEKIINDFQQLPENVISTSIPEQTITTEKIFTTDFWEPSMNALSDLYNETVTTEQILTSEFQQPSVNAISTVLNSTITEKTVSAEESVTYTAVTEKSLTKDFQEPSKNTPALDFIGDTNNNSVTIEYASANDLQQLPGNAILVVNSSSIPEQTTITTEQKFTTDFLQSSINATVSDLYNETVTTEQILTSGSQQPFMNEISTVIDNAIIEKTAPTEVFFTTSAVTEKTVPAKDLFTNSLQEPSINTPKTGFIGDRNNDSVTTEYFLTNDLRQPPMEVKSTVISYAVTEQTVATPGSFTRQLELPINATATDIINDINNQSIITETTLIDDLWQHSFNATPIVISNIVTEQTATTAALFTKETLGSPTKATVTENNIPIGTSDINKETVITEDVLNNISQYPSTNTTSTFGTEKTITTNDKLFKRGTEVTPLTVLPLEHTELTNNDHLNSDTTQSYNILNTDGKKIKPQTSIDIITTEADTVSSNVLYYQDLSRQEEKTVSTPTHTANRSTALHTRSNRFEKIAETDVEATTVASFAGSITNELLRTDSELISTIAPQDSAISEIVTILFNGSLETVRNSPSTLTLDDEHKKKSNEADELGLISKIEIVTPIDSGLVQANEFVTNIPTTERTARIAVAFDNTKVLKTRGKEDSLKKPFSKIENIMGNELLSTSFRSHINENKNGFLDDKIYEINMSTRDNINTPIPDAYNVETTSISMAENIGKSTITRNVLSEHDTTVTSPILNTEPVSSIINESNLSVNTNKDQTIKTIPNSQPVTSTSNTEFYYHTTITEPSIAAQPSEASEKFYGLESNIPQSGNTVLETTTFATDLLQTELEDLPVTSRTRSSTINIYVNSIKKQEDVAGNYSANETNSLENVLLNNVPCSTAKNKESIDTTTQKVSVELLMSRDQNEEAVATTKNVTIAESANVRNAKNTPGNKLEQELFFVTSNENNESNKKTFDFNLNNKSIANTVTTKIKEIKSEQTGFNTQSLLTAAKNLDVPTTTMNIIAVTTPTLIYFKENESSQSSNPEIKSVTLDLNMERSILSTANITSNKADISRAGTTSKTDLFEVPRDTTVISTPSSSIESVTYSTQIMTPSPTPTDITDPNDSKLSTSSYSASQLITKSTEGEIPQMYSANTNEIALQENMPLNTTSLIKDTIVQSSFGSSNLMFKSQEDEIQNSTILNPFFASNNSIGTLPMNFNTSLVKDSDTTPSKYLSSLANTIETQIIENVASNTPVEQPSLSGTSTSSSAVDYKSEIQGLDLKTETATAGIFSINIYDEKPSYDVANTGPAFYLITKDLEKTAEVSTLANSINTEKYILAPATPTARLQSETWKKEPNTNTNSYSPDKRSINKSFDIADLSTEPTPNIENIKSIKDNEKQSNSKTTISTNLLDFGVATEVIERSEVLVDRNTEVIKTHSGIISFLTPPLTNQEKKEKPEIKENEVKVKQVRTSTEVASLAAKVLSTSSTNILVTTLKNYKKEQNDISKREEVLSKTENNDLKPIRGIKVQEFSTTTINTNTNIVNVTNTADGESKKKILTNDLIKSVNSTTSTFDSHTSNSKSTDQNKSTVYAHNMIVISNDQSGTPRSISQITAAGDLQTTGFPAFESTTRKANSNKFYCTKKRGKYADELDCRKFYICIGNLHVVEGMCPVNTVFSEIRKQCTKNLSHCIRNNQFRCVTEGHFSDFLNDNVYYICVRNNVSSFIRFKLICQSGYHLNKTSVRCVLNNDSQQSSSKSDSSKSTSEQSASLTKQEEPEEEKKSEKKFKCKKEGIFADPSNCKRYFECTKTDSEFRQKRKKCDSGENFHKDKKKCVDSDSYEC